MRLPSSDLENIIKNIWIRILRKGNISTQDNLFKIGATSVDAVKIISATSLKLKLDIEISTIYKYPTIYRLANYISNMRQHEVSFKEHYQSLALNSFQKEIFLCKNILQHTSIYNIPLAFEIEGNFNLQHFYSAINKTLDQHHILKTTLLNDYHIIHSQEYNINQISDASACKIDKKDFSSNSLIINFFEQELDLSCQAPFQYKIFKQENNHYFVLFIFHHIVIDYTTINLFLTDLSKNYNSISIEKHESQINPMNYFHYTHKYEKLKAEKVYKNTLLFWKKYLQKINSEMFLLPIETIVTEKELLCQNLLLNRVTKNRIFELSALYSVTPFSFLITVLQIIFSRLYGKDQLIISSPFSIRLWSSFLKTIGLFVNLIPIKFNLNQEDFFVDVLKENSKNIALLSRNSHIDPKDLRNIINQTSQLDFKCLNQLIVTYEHKDTTLLNLNGTKSKFIEYNIKKSIFDLSIYIRETDENLSINFKYAKGKFDNIIMKKIIECLGEIIKSIISINGKCKISSLNMISTIENEYLNSLCHRSQTSTITYPNIVDQFKKITQNFAKCIAIRTITKLITYDELDKASDKYASIIQNNIRNPYNKRIAICMQQSIDTIAVMLAVLKNGLTYCYIDLELPELRLKNILTDLSPELIIIDDTSQNIIEIANFRQININSFDNSVTIFKKVNIEEQTNAYITYTSGTTGNPKGIVIPHRGVTSLVLDESISKLLHGSTISQAANLAFDCSVIEIWGALLNGASLALIPKIFLLEEQRLKKIISDLKINTLFLPTPLFNFFSVNFPHIFNNLTTIITGGDILTKNCVTDAFKYNIGLQQIINGYGPSESTCFTTLHIISRYSQLQENIPIGRPIGNREVYILDKYLNELPVGFTGEICIAGPGLAKGYLNNNDLTNSKFICKDSKIIYTSGDNGRYLADGLIEFLGRKDNQIKRNGYRIELTEIESLLTKHISFIESVVVICDNGYDKSLKLIAFVLVEQNKRHEANLIEKISTLSKSFLPEYMLLDEIKVIDKIPLTNIGKVDYQKLREYYQNDIINKINALDKTINVHTDIENELFAIWQNVLGTRPLSIDENFFDVGGTSFSITTLCTLINDKFNVSIKLTDAFIYTNIRSQALYLSSLFNININERNNIKLKNKNLDIIKTTDHCCDIAIIGMAGKFSGAEDIEQYWENIINYRNSVLKFEKHELLEFGGESSIINNTNFRPIAGVIKDIDHFDAEFFGLSNKIAKLLDPHHKVFLNLVWEGLQNSGYNPISTECKVGLFCGMSDSGSRIVKEMSNFPIYSKEYNEHFFYSNPAFLATQIAYRLGFDGPAINVNTACSTSLVAVIEACKNLINNSCDIAIAGGISLIMPDQIGYVFEREHVFSDIGVCAPFSNNSDGIVPGSGAGVVVCKRLEDALQNDDNIIAVIKGFSVNNDGNNKIGFAGPSVLGQQSCIFEAQKMAGVSAEQISYVETHGTATRLGDQVELEALTKAFSLHGINKKHCCPIGSVKANIGHANYASGIAGLIKSALIIKNKIIPKMPNFEANNPQLNIEETPFYINKENIKIDNDKQCIIGVSSFGIGGTNSHVILSSYDNVNKKIRSQNKNIFIVFSTKTKNSLEKYKQVLSNHLKNKELSQDELEDLAYTMLTARMNFKFRFAMFCRDINDAIKKLNSTIEAYNSIKENKKLYNIIKLWLNGNDLDLLKFIEKPKGYKRVPLPSYPFEKRKYIFSYDSKIHNNIDSNKTSIDILTNAWMDTLNTNTHILPNDDIFLLGVDSLSAIDMVVFIEKTFSIKISLDDLIKNNTINKQAKLVNSAIKQNAKNVLVNLQPLGKKQPLYFIHPIGGSIFCFMPLISRLSKDRAIWGLQDPVLHEDFSEFANIEEVAKKYLTLLRKVQPDGPYMIAGYSAGGTIAYEMASQLILSGEKVNSLILFDAWASLPSNLTDEAYFKHVILRQLEYLKLHIFPGFSTNESLWHKTLWNRMSILSNYQPKPLDISLTLFKATVLENIYIVLKNHNKKYEDSNGWAAFVKPINTIPIHAKHEELFHQSNISVLSQHLETILTSLS